MKVVGICGSSRRGGSEYLIEKALNDLKDNGIEVDLKMVKDNAQ